MTELMEMTEKMDQHDRLNGCTDCLILPVLFVEPSRNLSLIRLGTNVLLHHPVIMINILYSTAPPCNNDKIYYILLHYPVIMIKYIIFYCTTL